MREVTKLAIKLATALLLPLSAQAMTLETQGDTLFATGPLGNDLQAFETHLSNSALKRVAFVNSPGGDTWTALRVGRLIADKGLSTVVAGFCNSACSIMFMAGKQRQFSDAFPANATYVGIHGAHAKDTRKVDSSLQPQLFAWYKQTMGERFNGAIMNRALYEMEDAGSLLKVYDNARPPRRVTHHCISSQTPRTGCTDFPEAQALDLGVVTHPELIRLSVPDAFKPANVLFGQSLNVRIDNFSAWLSQEAQRTCSAEACRAKTSEWNPTRESWAFAGGQGRGAGWGRTEGRDSLTQAALGAIYACNHRSNGSTALCEVSGANGFDLSGLYSTAKAAHDSAKAQLRAAPALAERAFASEDFGRGNVPDSGALRTQKLIDLTPLTLTPGIRTLLTGDLVTLLKSEPQTYILDVSNDASEALPGAATLWFGGAALDDPKAEEALDQRFRKLLTLTAPDVNAPLVVYGPSRNNWLGVNAAMRAQRAGWNNVFWYRGGLEAWRTAGLPTAPLLLRAAVR